MTHTALARWLERKLGWRRLLRACVGLEPSKFARREITLTDWDFDETPWAVGTDGGDQQLEALSGAPARENCL